MSIFRSIRDRVQIISMGIFGDVLLLLPTNEMLSLLVHFSSLHHPNPQPSFCLCLFPESETRQKGG